MVGLAEFLPRTEYRPAGCALAATVITADGLPVWAVTASAAIANPGGTLPLVMLAEPTSDVADQPRRVATDEHMAVDLRAGSVAIKGRGVLHV